MDNGAEPFLQSVENGHASHAELIMRYAPNPETGKAFGELYERVNRRAIEGHFGVPAHVFGDALHDMFGPHASNYNLWLRRIKKTFDPNGASESSTYISLKE